MRLINGADYVFIFFFLEYSARYWKLTEPLVSLLFSIFSLFHAIHFSMGDDDDAQPGCPPGMETLIYDHDHDIISSTNV